MRFQEPGTKSKFRILIIPSWCKSSINDVLCQFLTKSNQSTLKISGFVFLLPYILRSLVILKSFEKKNNIKITPEQLEVIS